MDNYDKTTLIAFLAAVIGLILFGLLIFYFNTPPQSDFNKESISLDKNCVVKEKIVEKVFNPFSDLNCPIANQADLNKWVSFDLRQKGFFSLNYFSSDAMQVILSEGESMSPLIKNGDKLLVDFEYDFDKIGLCDIIMFYEPRLSSKYIAHFVRKVGVDGQGKFVQTMGVHNGSADFLIRKENFYGKVIAILGG